MKIDPENYDLRELRRIADERRADRRGRPSESDETSEEAERESDRRRPRREGPPNRSGRNDARRSRDGRDRPRQSNGRRDDPRGDEDRRRNRDGARRRDGRSERLSRPREGYSDHGEAQDEVVRADQLASELGLGRPFGDASRGGRGRSENGRSRSENGRSRSENGREGNARDGRRYDDSGYGDYDELGYSAYDEGRGGDGRSGRDAGYDRRSDDHPEDVGRFRFDKEVHERPRGRAGETLRQNQLEQLLVHETAAAGDSLEKPYLRTLPNEYAAERVVFDWLEFLVLKGGFKRTMDALRYYLTVDWITEDVETELHDYLIGFSGNVADTTEFDVDDHHLSLLYVARLTSMT